MTHTATAFYRDGHGRSPVKLSTAEDIDRLIDDLMVGAAESVASLFVDGGPLTQHNEPDHELRIGVDAETRTGSVYYSGGMDAWYAVGGVTRHVDGLVYSYMNNREDFPRDAELDLAQVRELTKEFLATGGDRPASTTWKPWAPEEF